MKLKTNGRRPTCGNSIVALYNGITTGLKDITKKIKLEEVKI